MTGCLSSLRFPIPSYHYTDGDWFASLYFLLVDGSSNIEFTYTASRSWQGAEATDQPEFSH